MRTKAEILTAKRDYLAHALDMAQREIDGLKGMECNLTCDGCGTVLATEWDFSSHFIIPDERYVNLGGCPVKDKAYTRDRVTVHFVVSTQIGI